MYLEDETAYLEDKIDGLFERYHKFFIGQDKNSLRSIANNESNINYRNFSDKILLPNGKFHKFDFFKKYGTLYSLLKELLTKKTNANNANFDQISFIIYSMYGCDESKLIDIMTIRDKFYFHDAFLTKTKIVFLGTTKNPKKGIKTFFPPKFREYLPKDHQSVILNAMELYNYRNKIFRLFQNKNIRPSMNAKSDPEEYDGAEKSEQKFDESIGQKVKLRRKKADETGDE